VKGKKFRFTSLLDIPVDPTMRCSVFQLALISRVEEESVSSPLESSIPTYTL
jgi:hypothetical protein